MPTVGFLPITKEIVVGTVRNGKWIGKRTVITDEALASVADYLLNTDQHLEFEVQGKKNSNYISQNYRTLRSPLFLFNHWR